jgi:endonuclease-3
MDFILRKMDEALAIARPARMTALKRLQAEEQGDPFKILIGTILSARTRDESTTRVVGKLFSRFKDAAELAAADIEEIKRIIHSIGFYNVKAHRIKTVAEIIVQNFGGRVPETIDELLELPGVGRKTANCVLVYGFDKPAIPVDVHVHRISNRLGIVSTKNPEQTEAALEKLVSKNLWVRVNDGFVMYGQNICLPRSPRCEQCLLTSKCLYFAARRKETNRRVSFS